MPSRSTATARTDREAVTIVEAGSRASWSGLRDLEATRPSMKDRTFGPTVTGDSSVRPAGRVDPASLATDAEYDELNREHRLLAEREVLGELSRKERLRLQMVRWHLDRIESARYGLGRDVLEKVVERQEALATRVQELVDGLREHQIRDRRRR